MSTSPEHKLIFALVVIIIVLLVSLAMYVNYKYVAEERGLSIIADLDVWIWGRSIRNIIN
ncbi:MAG: hypothetical protein WA941_05390 [Nitrososphaeraceae archaeon]